MRFKTTPNHLLIVPVLSTALIVGVACKPEGRSTSKDTIYTYEMSATNKSGKKVGGTYEYGGRKAKYSSKSGKFSTTAKTAGPKRAQISVVVPVGTGPVSCVLVVKRNSDRIAKVTNSGGATTSCVFKP